MSLAPARSGNLTRNTNIPAEQVRLLYTGTLLSVTTSTFLAAILAYMQRSVISNEIVFGWFALIVLLACVRASVFFAFRRAGPGAADNILWLRRFRLGVLATGVVWGSAGYLLFPAGNAQHQMFLVFMLAGLSAGGMIAYSVDLVSAIAFVLTVLSPFVIRLFVAGDNVSIAMGMAGLLYLCFIMLSMRYIYRHMRENIRLHIDAITRDEVLQQSEERYRLLLRYSPIGILHYDTDLIVTYCNDRFADILNTSSEHLVGLDMNRLKDQGVLPALSKVLKGEHGYFEGHYQATFSNATVDISMSCAPSRDSKGKITGGIAIVEDVTAQKKSQQEIYDLAFLDPLTQLSNRRLLLDRLQHALATTARNGRKGALLFIDLDHFKMLNDTLGHDKGDLLLQEVAQRIAGCVRECDTVARLGGDEYVVMLEDLEENPDEAAKQSEAVGEKILAQLRKPYSLNGHPYHITTSIGVALFQDPQDSVNDLMKWADLAMYQAKAAGRNNLRFFDPSMHAELTAHATMASDLREGFQKSQFQLYYQPQVDASGHTLGAEVLLRWNHPRKGLIHPAEFIPLAESMGLIVPIGHWVLETACAQLVVWAQQPATARLTLSVNVSARQFRMPDFVDQVMAVLDYTHADPQKLELELTESLLLDNVDETIVKMNALKELGVHFSLDDFGTGYSSLAYLKRLPLDLLKIDRSFVMDLERNENDATICAAVVGLAHSLGLKVVAEGVENEAQRHFLTTIHQCDFMQGYLFGKPLPLADFEALLVPENVFPLAATQAMKRAPRP